MARSSLCTDRGQRFHDSTIECVKPLKVIRGFRIFRNGMAEKNIFFSNKKSIPTPALTIWPVFFLISQDLNVIWVAHVQKTKNPSKNPSLGRIFKRQNLAGLVWTCEVSWRAKYLQEKNSYKNNRGGCWPLVWFSKCLFNRTSTLWGSAISSLKVFWFVFLLIGFATFCRQLV